MELSMQISITKLKKLFGVLLIAAFTATTANAAIFLKIPGVDGESFDAVHKNEIDVLAWSWGTQTDGRATCIDSFNFVKFADLASPTLLMNQAQGVIYPTATISINRSTGDTPVKYIELAFKNAIVTTIQTGGRAGEDRLTENVSFNFEEVKYTYRRTNPDGTTAEPVTATIRSTGNCK